MISGAWSGVGGIIPARAGFTRGRLLSPGQRRDHPRSRGVYGRWGSGLVLRMGSSPLARGLQDDVVGPRRWRGIIPARAGFTRYRDRGVHDAQDHPRSRGVYEQQLVALVAPVGSSPLARGLQVVVNLSQKVGGIIPARAGFTGPGSPLGPGSPDHPRSRGVY